MKGIATSLVGTATLKLTIAFAGYRPAIGRLAGYRLAIGRLLACYMLFAGYESAVAQLLVRLKDSSYTENMTVKFVMTNRTVEFFKNFLKIF